MTSPLQTGFFDRPLRAGQFTLRPYQVEARDAVFRELDAKASTMVVQCTGGGKTVLFCEVAKQFGGALAIAHRDTLIRQAAAKLELATGLPIAIEKAQERAHFGAKYIVASVQTLRGERLKRFALRFPSIPLIIVDEGHRGTAPGYRAIAAAFPKAKRLYVTATPDRSDGVGMGTVVESVAHEYNIIAATDDGYLTPLKFVPIQSDIDLDALKITQQDGEKDFDQAQLDEEVTKEAGRVARAVLSALDDAGPTSRFIAFTPGVKTAHACADATNELRAGTAAVVDGTLSDDEKRPIMEAHAKGEVRVVFNCNVLTEGHDDPTLTGVIDLSPSKSRLRVSQRWGRATRLWPGVIDGLEDAQSRRAAIAMSPKPWALIYDLVANSVKHDVIGPLDLLAGKDLPEKTRAEAKKILREKGGTVQDAVKEARDRLRAIAAARRIALAAKITMGKPRTIFERVGAFYEEKKGFKPLPTRPEDYASAAMKWRLKEDGIPVPAGCTQRAFRRLLAANNKRKANGMCQLGGVEFLRKYGIDAWSLTSEQAKRAAYAIAENGFKPLTPEKLGEAIEREVGSDDV